MQIGNDLVSIGLDKTAKLVGQEPTKNLNESLVEFGDKLEGVKMVFNSPAGKRVLNNLGSVAEEIGEDIVAPALEKTSDVLLKKSGEIGNKAVSAGIDILAATPIAPLIEIPKFVSDVSTGAMKGVEAASDIISIGSDSIKEIKGKQEQVTGIMSELQDLLKNGSEKMNEGISSGLNVAENMASNLDKYTDSSKVLLTNKMTDMQNGVQNGLTNKMTDMQNGLTNKMTDMQNGVQNGLTNKMNDMQNGVTNKMTGLQSGLNKSLKNSLNNIQKGGKIVSKRVQKSQLEFLSPHVTTAQIIRRLNKTRKNVKKRR